MCANHPTIRPAQGQAQSSNASPTVRPGRQARRRPRRAGRWIGALFAGLAMNLAPPAPAQQPATRATVTAAASGPSRLSRKMKARRLYEVLTYTLVIFIAFLTGTFAIVRFSRRYHRFLASRPSTPTQSADVWAMHRVPDELMPSRDPPRRDGDDDESDQERGA